MLKMPRSLIFACIGTLSKGLQMATSDNADAQKVPPEIGKTSETWRLVCFAQ